MGGGEQNERKIELKEVKMGYRKERQVKGKFLVLSTQKGRGEFTL